MFSFKKYQNSLSFIWQSFKEHKKMFYVFFVGKIIEGFFYVVIPILAKMEMDQLVEQNKKLFGIITLSPFNIFLVILFLIFIFRFLEDFLKGIISLFEYDYTKIYENLFSASLYKRLENLQPGLFLNARNKKFIGDVISSGTDIGYLIREFLGKLITNFFTVFGIFGVLVYIDYKIFIVLLVSSIIIYYIQKKKEKIQEKQRLEEEYEYDHKVWILTREMSQNLTLLISNGGFKLVYSYYKKFNDQIRRSIKKQQNKTFILNTFSFLVENISEIFVKIIVAFGIFFYTTSIGTMSMVLLYTSRVQELFSFVRDFKFSLNRLIDDLSKLELLLELTSKKSYKNKKIKNLETITFKNLNFSYPNFVKEELKYLEIWENRIKSYGENSEYTKDELYLIKEAREELKQKNPIVLKDINLFFELGKTYGLVGKNGAGKTTIISLLMNFFDDYNGSIKINNIEVKNINKEFFENNISIINQVPYIIEGFTIRENILLGVKKLYSDDEIYNLLEKFGLKNKVLKSRKGLDAEIGYNNDFSGGEKQLLAIIRVILQDRKILIMDEGTNQLDAENEIFVMEELLKNKKDKIIIFITHRMTTIRKVDMIYGIENGKITISGKHKDLIKSKNIYSRFWKKQVEE